MPIIRKYKAIFNDKLYEAYSFYSKDTLNNIQIYCIIGTQEFSEQEYLKRAARLRQRTICGSIKNRNSGLSDSINGHLNKHLLKMKYYNKKIYETAAVGVR